MPRAERSGATRKAVTAVRPGTGGRGDTTAARNHSETALNTLVAIMTSDEASATARISAANAVLDRAWGKPRQDVEVSGTIDAVAAIQRARQRVHRQRETMTTGATAAHDTGGEGDCDV